MTIIFLDIDGVLNTHTAMPNGYFGICRQRVELLNELLEAVPEAKLVISSAWRYMLHRGVMTIQGFEYLLITHGVMCKDRIIGYTAMDTIAEPPAHDDIEAWSGIGLALRAQQIEEYITANAVTCHVVLDDLAIAVNNLVQTNSTIGLTAEHISIATQILRGELLISR